MRDRINGRVPYKNLGSGAIPDPSFIYCFGDPHHTKLVRCTINNRPEVLAFFPIDME